MDANVALLHGCTPEEAEFGFSIRETRSGIYAVAAELEHGLLAVKVQTADGEVEYRVCNDALAQLYKGARSIEELRARFSPAGRSSA